MSTAYVYIHPPLSLLLFLCLSLRVSLKVRKIFDSSLSSVYLR